MSQAIRVLLVDDDEDDYILTRDLLAEIGRQKFKLEWMDTYAAGLEEIQQKRHDVYLLDYHLGAHNGLELLREAIKGDCRAPMILLTGQGDREVDIEAMKAGAADYLVKGRIDAPLLERSIRYALERTRTLETLRQSEATNRGLLAETQARLREQVALREAGSIIASTLDLKSVLSRIAEQMARALDATSAYICSLESEPMAYTVVAEYIGSQACPQEQVSDLGVTYRDNDSRFLEALQAGRPDISQIDDPDLPEAERAHLQQCGTRTVLYISLQVRGQVIAFAELWESRRRREFTSEEIVLCQVLAQQAAIAIENARLYEQAQQEIVERKRAEVALRESEEKYRDLVDNALVGIYRTNLKGEILYANQELARILEFESPAEIKSAGALARYRNPQDRQVLIEHLKQKGRVTDFEVALLTKTGKVKNVVLSATLQGDILSGMMMDVTERMQAEQEILARNRELALLNQIITASASGVEPRPVLEAVCRELAQAFELPSATAALLNEEKSEAVVVAEYLSAGQLPALHKTIPVADNLSFQFLLTHQAPLIVEDAQNDPRLAPIRGLMRERETASLLFLPLIIEDQVIGGLGVEAREPRHFSAEEVSLAWSVADQVSGALARVRLAEAQRRLSAAIEQAAEGMMITDVAGTILYVNPAFEQITGYSQAEVLGQKPSILGEAESRQSDTLNSSHIVHTMLETIGARQIWNGRIAGNRKDGSSYIVEVTIAPVRDERDNVLNYVSLLRDVTRELELEEQYRQAQKMEAVGRLTAGIAHDFNNMLTAINGFAELLQFELAPDDPRQELVDKILGPGQRAADLVRKLLTFSRKQIIEPKVLNLNTIVSNMSGMLRRTIGEDIDLEINLLPDLWSFKADLAQIEQIIVNLAVNARDAMPYGGKLVIETANAVLDADYVADHRPDLQPGDYVLLTVSDTGIGMSEEVLDHIFEPFFTTKEPGKGTGLGLAIIFGIVKQNSGDVRVQSTEGQGTTFSIYLPRSEETCLSPTQPQNDADMPAGRETILLVEDDEKVRELTRQVLQRQRYSLLEARDGQEALQLSDHHPGSIHLLLTDVVMPGMSGKVLAEQLTQARPDLKVLFMSGYADDAILHHGVVNSGIALLQKPFSSMALARRVRTVLDG
jgi:PAS domain S-box-containing protein